MEDLEIFEPIPEDEYIVDGEALEKALGDIPVGTQTRPTKNQLRLVDPDKRGPDKLPQRFDYSHLLSPILKRNYTIHIQHDPVHNNLHANVRYKGREIGFLQTDIHNPNTPEASINVWHGKISKAHQGRGLGKSMYTAAFVHGLNHLGVKMVRGGKHSSLMNRVHSSLAQTHGFEYDPMPLPPKKSREKETPGSYDDAFSPYSYAIKEELGKNEDGIENMLQVDDPMERKLALKTKAIDPYHLRMALEDEDPDVRLAAAHHPAMTPELIKEVLHGHDKWLAEQILTRSDLRPDELEDALADPELRSTAALHPALTEEQRNSLLDSDETPEGLKEHIHQALIKNIGFVTFPQLGEGRAHSVPQIIDHRPDFEGMVGYNAHKPEPMHAHGNENHEIQHGVFAKMKHRHGSEITYKVVAHTLSALDPDHRNHVFGLLDAAHGTKDPVKRPEEAISYLHNYLSDPEHRRFVHVNMRISRDINAMRASVQKARKAWMTIQNKASTMRPEDVGAKFKKDEVLLSEFVAKLKKGHDKTNEDYADQLGMNLDLQGYINAAKFLTGKELDPEILRRHLIENDDDIKEAVLKAAGLESEAQKKAFENIFKFQDDMQKSQVQLVETVEAVLPKDEDVAKQLRWAFQNDEVEPVYLGGKHSKGMMMAKDRDGQLLLIKPGSGKISPIAGAREEKANQSRREAAFYDVAQAWGFTKTIPRAALIVLDGKETAVFEMLPLDWQGLHKTRKVDPSIPQKSLRAYLDSGVLHKWAVLDYVLGNGDRHGQNLMVSPADEGHKISLIDHGSAFAGEAFDPGNDNSSFVPYYLRAWGPEKGFSRLSTAEKLATLPILHEQTDWDFRQWIESLDADALEKRIHRFGINPAATVARLKALKDAVAGAKNASRVIDEFWLK